MLGWEGPLTHRQFITWQYWLREQYNHPSRSDFYLMQVARAAELVPSRVWGGNPQVELDKMRITFTDPSTQKELTEEEKLEEARRVECVWMARLGIPPPILSTEVT